jgi:hypothetical protein
MSDRTSILVILDDATAMAIAAVAVASGRKAEELAASILSNWIGPCTATAFADRAKERSREAARRLSILQGWWESRRLIAGRKMDDATASYLASLRRRRIHISRGTLYLWERKWAAGGIDGLVDNRVGTPGKPSRFIEEIQRLMAASRRPRFAQAFRQACELAQQRNWKVMTERNARRYIAPVKKNKSRAA